jgi:hypothetical protein
MFHSNGTGTLITMRMTLLDTETRAMLATRTDYGMEAATSGFRP